MNTQECRWGFLGPAAIARKVWKAIRVSGNGRIVAVASRSKDRAAQFVSQCSAEVPFAQAVEAVESYQALIERDDIDAVYVPLPTGLRKQWVIAAAKAGKHVLCEKPSAVHADDLKAMIDACDQAGVQFMDGVMFDHSQRMNEIHARLRDEKPLGKIRRIASHFSFTGDEAFQASNIRTDAALEPHGSLGDLGWYCIRFTLRVTDLQMPTHVTARTLTPLQGKDSTGQVPGEFSGELTFADGLSAAFYCSFLTANQQTATVSGEKGYLEVDDFVLPLYGASSSYREHRHALEIDNCRWNFGRRTEHFDVPEYASGEADSQEVRMVRTFAQAAIDGKVDPFYPKLSLQTQLILDACRRSDAAGGKSIAL